MELPTEVLQISPTFDSHLTRNTLWQDPESLRTISAREVVASGRVSRARLTWTDIHSSISS